jgi:hypothetical protein
LLLVARMPKARASARARTPLASYTNYFEVGHNAYEFLIDFGQYQPEVEEVAPLARIVLGPTHAKLLAATLTAAIENHEAEHGSIPQIADSTDALAVVLRSLPDFERRAIDARQAPRSGAPARRLTHKR